MSSYGVQPTGFVRKPLPIIQAEIEAQLITEFGPDVVQTSQSPLGQINGLFADIIGQLWEIAEDVYQSIDPDQAEGQRLDTLGRLRLLGRGESELDNAFRQAITNEGTARIDVSDLARAVQNVDGVTYRQVFVNETSSIDRNGLSPNTVSVAVLGGEDAEVAEAINRYVIPGVSTYGNMEINTLEDGYCRALYIVRPVEVPVELTVTVRTSADRRGCPPPSPAAIEAALLTYLRGSETRPWNGQNITAYTIRSFIEATFPTVEFVKLQGERDGMADPEMGGDVSIAFVEIADVQSVEVLVD